MSEVSCEGGAELRSVAKFGSLHFPPESMFTFTGNTHNGKDFESFGSRSQIKHVLIVADGEARHAARLETWRAEVLRGPTDVVEVVLINISERGRLIEHVKLLVRRSRAGGNLGQGCAAGSTRSGSQVDIRPRAAFKSVLVHVEVVGDGIGFYLAGPRHSKRRDARGGSQRQSANFRSYILADPLDVVVIEVIQMHIVARVISREKNVLL